MNQSTMQVTRGSRASRIAMFAGLLLLIILIAAPLWAGRADMRLMGELFLYLALASLWNLMAGYAGLVSVGQQAYVGFGGYILFALTIFAGVHPIIALLGAGLLGALIAVPVATLVFRLRGAYFCHWYLGDGGGISFVFRSGFQFGWWFRYFAAD